MKKTFLVLLVLLAVLLAACGKSQPTATPAPSVTESAPAAADHPDITGVWALTSSGDDASMRSALTALTDPNYFFDFIVITEDYIQAGGYAYAYHWDGEDRILVDGLVTPWGSVMGPLDVQLSGSHLRLTVPNYPDAWLDYTPRRETAAAETEAAPTGETDSPASFGPPTPTPYVACPGQDPTRLWVGGYAAVTPGLPNRLRSGAGKSFGSIGQIASGQAMEILDGPQCADGWVWYQVRVLETGQIGWTAEGDGQGVYWLEPCAPGSECGQP